MYNFQAAYPTLEHEQAAQRVLDFFVRQSDVQAILLTCSCARGKATPDSCLDMAILVNPQVSLAQQQSLEVSWEALYQTDAIFQSLRSVGKYSHVDMEFVSGRFEPGSHDWTSGPDAFELAIGNLLVYSVPLGEQGDALRQLKSRWLPYYGDDLRRERLTMVHRYCLNNLQHIPGYVTRGLYFQAFHRLWQAFGEFLQALFISRRVYPIAYDKWVREQIEEILELPSLYEDLSHLFEIQRFESDEIAQQAHRLENLLAEFVPAPERA